MFKDIGNPITGQNLVPDEEYVEELVIKGVKENDKLAKSGKKAVVKSLTSQAPLKTTAHPQHTKGGDYGSKTTSNSSIKKSGYQNRKNGGNK